MRALWRNALLIRLLILALYILFACLYRMLPHISFFSSLFPYFLLIYLSFPLRIDPPPFQAGCHNRQAKPGFIFSGFVLYCRTILLIGECVLLLC